MDKFAKLLGEGCQLRAIQYPIQFPFIFFSKIQCLFSSIYLSASSKNLHTDFKSLIELKIWGKGINIFPYLFQLWILSSTLKGDHQRSRLFPEFFHRNIWKLIHNSETVFPSHWQGRSCKLLHKFFLPKITICKTAGFAARK